MDRRSILTLCLASAALAGCHWKSPAERAAAEIVEKNAQARGGVEAWRRVKSMVLSGSLDAGQRRDPLKLAMSYQRPKEQVRAEARRALRQGKPAAAGQQVQLPFVMELKRPHAARVEVKFQGQTALQVYDGKQGWKLRPFLGRHEVEPFSAEELRLAAQESELDGLLLDASAKGSRVELEGSEPVEGRDAFRLKVTLAGGQVRHDWVDKQTFLEVKVDGTRKLGGQQRSVWTLLRDYRPVDGLLIPHLLETSVEGVKGAEKIVVEKVALNAPLDDARFAKPD
jgi:outer membrane lipoprotein-sorting protein